MTTTNVSQSPSLEDTLAHATKAVQERAAGCRFVLHLAGERSDYVRFNHGRVRQSGSVAQLDATLTVADGQRHGTERLTLSGDSSLDTERLQAATERLRRDIASLDKDPFFLFADDDDQTPTAKEVDLDQSPSEDGEEVVRAICSEANGLDFVGILANGRVERAVSTSGGKRRLFAREITHVDWSIYAGEGAAPDKAIKQSWAGAAFDRPRFSALLNDARERLPVLRRDEKRVEPGAYRAYLAPAAVDEILSLLAYGTFSQRALQSKTSALLRLQLGEAQFDERFHLVEDVAGGTAPQFSQGGFDRPAEVVLIDRGRFGNGLTSPRSAKEYGLRHTGADASEIPVALRLDAGALDEDDALARLGTGVYVGNLWYCNFSDPQACRVTGMTRFGTFWVEDGTIVAPLAPMRFDASLYTLLGEALEDLTATNPLSVDADTYGQRSTSSKRVPGALVGAFPFTL